MRDTDDSQMQLPEGTVRVYWLAANDVHVRRNGEKQRVDILARFIDSREDSPQVREELCARVAEQIGLKELLASKCMIQVMAICPIKFAGEEYVEVERSLPYGRAKVRVVFRCEDSSQYESISNFEQHLEDSLAGTEVGYVDGNDVGMGEYCIYCHGPRKQPLVDYVRSFCERNAPAGYKVT